MVVDCYKVDGECCTTDQARNQEGRNYHLFHPGATTHSNKKIKIKSIPKVYFLLRFGLKNPINDY